jgi:hypothetical protein
LPKWQKERAYYYIGLKLLFGPKLRVFGPDKWISQGFKNSS